MVVCKCVNMAEVCVETGAQIWILEESVSTGERTGVGQTGDLAIDLLIKWHRILKSAPL